MNSHLVPSPRRLAAGEALRLGRHGGELTVVAGRVWLTRSGDLGDHVLAAGQRVRVAAVEDAVVEAWDADHGAVLRWAPSGPGFVGAVLAEPLRGVAFLAGRLAGGFAGVARHAAAGAARARGDIGPGADSVLS